LGAARSEGGPDARILGVFGPNDIECPVGGAVVDDNDLVSRTCLVET
jgi:hypothetical protein